MVAQLRRFARWWYRTDWVIALTLFLLAIIPRLIPNGMFMDPDSALQWVARTRGFTDALGGGNPAGFAPDVHPGVPLLWLTAAGLGLWKITATLFSGLDPVESFTWTIKLPVAITTSLLILPVWGYTRRIVGRSLAVVIGIFFALDPLYLVYSRYVHLDALITGFILSGLLAVWYGLTARRLRDVGIGAIFLCLASLTRFNGLLAVLVAAGYIIFWGQQAGRVKPIVTFILVGICAALVVWPAVLLSPGQILFLINNRIGLALVPHEVPPNVDVIPWVRALLYEIFITTREFPLVLAGVLPGIVRVVRDRGAVGSLGRMLGLFTIVFLLGLYVMPKDLDRYALPVIGPLAYFSAVGWQEIWRSLRRRWVKISVVLLACAQLFMFYRLAPYFQTYQNFLTLGMRDSPVRTSQALDPSWGEGIGEAMAYLKDRHGTLPPTAMWFAGIGCYYGHPHTSEYYPINGRTEETCPPGLRFLSSVAGAEYLVLSRDQIAQRIYPKLLDDIDRLGWQPEKIISINGVQYISIYRNRGGLAEHYSLTGR